MAAPIHPVELLDWLERNQLLTPEQARELRPLLPTFPDARLLAKELIQRNWLTPYQVNQIMQGKQEQLILGYLRLRERLGEGAMGQVFKAWNTKLERIVAVKTLHKDLVANARAMERFRQEIEAVAQLDHPNIVKVRDADEIDSRPFLVMDYIDAANLSFLVKTQGPLPISIAVECVRQAAVGLQHAFERGVIHRDIKPANLLLQAAQRGAPPTDFCVKLLDFGLARTASTQRTAVFDAAHATGQHAGNGGLHGTGAGRECARCGHSRGHLRPGLYAVFPVNGQASLRRRERRGEDRCPPGRPAAERARGTARGVRRPGQRGAADDGAPAGGPVSDTG